MKALLAAALLLLAAVAIAPAADASPPNCYEQYSQTTVGPVTVIRRNSCDPGTVYFCGHNVLFEELDTSCL
jgi:hypothetical protein